MIPTTEEQRDQFLQDAGYNVFNFPARALQVDLLTDSGTCALLQSNLSALLLGDESYAWNSWYYAFLDALRDLVERGSFPRKAFLKLMDPSLSHQEFRNEFIEYGKGQDSYIHYDQLQEPNTYLLP